MNTFLLGVTFVFCGCIGFDPLSFLTGQRHHAADAVGFNEGDAFIPLHGRGGWDAGHDAVESLPIAARGAFLDGEAGEREGDGGALRWLRVER